MYKHLFCIAAGLTGLFGIPALARASMAWPADGGFPSTQKVPDGFFNYGPVIRAGGLGSGGLFDIVKNVKDAKGNTYFQLDFLSAAHVTTGQFGYAAFQAQNGVSYYLVDAANATNTTVYSGGPTGSEDLSMIGVDVPTSALNPTTAEFLNGLSSESKFLTANGLQKNSDFRSYGWGQTAIGTAYYQDGDHRVGAFILPNANGGRPVDRYILGEVSQIKQNFKLNPYTYQSYTYQFQTKVGYGITDFGDSGGVTLDDNGNWVGITTAADKSTVQADPFIPGKKVNAIVEGANGDGLLFTQADVDWLKQQAATFNALPLTNPKGGPAPAPAPGAVVVFALNALRLRRRRRSGRISLLRVSGNS